MYFSGSTICQTPCKIDYCMDKLVNKTGQTLSSKSLYFIRMGSFTYTDRKYIYIRLKYMVLYIKPNPWAFLVSHSLLPTTPLQNHSAHPAALLWAPGAELVSFSFVPSFFCTSLGHQHDQNSFWSITIFYYWCLLSYFLILRL